jgi:hypothetical protein
MSFGYSVGDVIAIGSLLFKIGATLRDSTGSSADYQELVLRFDCFEQLLKTVRRQIASSQLPRPAAHAIIGHVSKCEPLLRKFDTTTEKYKKSLSRGGSGKKLKDSWRKIGWGMYKRDEILELYEGLGTQMDAINLLLSCCAACVENYDQTDNLNQALMKSHFSEVATCVAGQATETLTILKRIENTIPQDMPLWASDYKPIKFVDALNMQIQLPFELCRNFKVITAYKEL